MKTLLKSLILLAFGAVIYLPGVAAAGTNLYFDDVPGGIIGHEAIPLPTNYGGFTWSASSPNAYWGVLDNISYRNNPGFAGNSFDFPTNPNVVINEDGNVGAARVMISSPLRLILTGPFWGRGRFMIMKIIMGLPPLLSPESWVMRRLGLPRFIYPPASLYGTILVLSALTPWYLMRQGPLVGISLWTILLMHKSPYLPAFCSWAQDFWA